MAIGYSTNEQLIVNLGEKDICVTSFIHGKKKPKAVLCFTPVDKKHEIRYKIENSDLTIEAKSIIHFDNVESLDLVIRHLNRLRNLITQGDKYE